MKPGTPRRLLFVCTGNTCRSPMAAVLAGRLAKTGGLDQVFSSAGTEAIDGVPLSRGAVTVLASRKAGPVAHHARRLTAQIVAEADEIYAMTRAHRDEIVARFPEAAAKTSVLREAAGLTPADVADPVGGDEAAYEASAASIEEALAILIRRTTDAHAR